MPISSNQIRFKWGLYEKNITTFLKMFGFKDLFKRCVEILDNGEHFMSKNVFSKRDKTYGKHS